MKKYNFIVGLGTGLILSSLFVFIGYNTESTDNNNSVAQASDDEIINEAKRLGMIFVSELPESEVVENEDNKPQEPEIQEQLPDELSGVADVTEENAVEVLETIEVIEISPEDEIIVEIPKGITSFEIVEILKGHGVIEDERAFNQYLMDKDVTKLLRYGEHRFAGNLTYDEILNIMRS